jgi:hypothetical protein
MSTSRSTPAILIDGLAEDNMALIVTEYVDPTRLRSALSASDKIDASTMKILKAMKKGVTNGNELKRPYDLHKTVKSLGLGRMYAPNPSLVNLPKDIRNYIAEPLNHDLDMVNAHPSLLLNLCEQHDIPCPSLREYVTNRAGVSQALAEAAGITLDEAKDQFRIMMYLGKMRPIRNEAYTFANDFSTEMVAVALRLSELYPAAAKAAADKRLKGALDDPLLVGSRNAVHASTMSYVLCTIERKAIRAAILRISQMGRDCGAIVYDGFHVRKLHGETILPNAILEAASAAVLEECGMRVAFAVKPMVSTLQLPEGNDPVDVSDDDAAARFVDAAGAENFVMVGRDLFVFDAETGLWSDEEKVFKRLVHKHKDALKFPKRNYGGDEYLMARMKKCISNHVRDEDNFWEDKYDTAIGYLLFSDGILNMRTGEFREGFNPAIVFKGRIDRPYYGGSPDANALAMVDKMIFEDPFTKEQIEQGVPVYQKKAWGRSLAGTYRDRQGYWNIGGTATSKGLTCTAVTESCGSYVGTFDINAFKFNPGSTSDAAKLLSWVVPIAYKRIILSNEPPQGVTLNGNLLKLFVSGGDGMVVRQCNQNERTVVNRATPHLFGNDAPKIKPVDEAYGDRFGGVVEYKVSFTLTADGSQPDVEKRRNIHAKDLFKQDKYRDAFLHVLITAFQDYLRNGHERPEVIVKAMREWFIEENSLESVLDGGYDVTGNESDYITFKELWEYCGPRLGDTCSKKKLGIDLAKIAGVTSDRKKIRGKTAVVYYGLARVEDSWVGDEEA